MECIYKSDSHSLEKLKEVCKKVDDKHHVPRCQRHGRRTDTDQTREKYAEAMERDEQTTNQLARDLRYNHTNYSGPNEKALSIPRDPSHRAS
jgi:hypothetical protein